MTAGAMGERRAPDGSVDVDQRRPAMSKGQARTEGEVDEAKAAQAAAQEPTGSVERAVEKWKGAGVPEQLASEAAVMVASGFFKDAKTTAQALVKIMAGRELGFTAFQSMKYIHIFETGGNVQMQIGYPLVAARINASPNYRYEVEEHTDKACRIAFYRLSQGSERKLGVSALTIEEAQRAGLTNKSTWMNWPRTMLFARALTNGAKWYCAEVLGGAEVGEEPYFEGSARVLEAEEIPEEVHEPPEGYTEPWKRFWSVAKGDPDTGGLGMSEDDVHEFFGVPAGKGELKASAVRKANNERKSEAQVVAEMEMLLREAREHAETGLPPEVAEEEALWESRAEEPPPEEPDEGQGVAEEFA